MSPPRKRRPSRAFAGPVIRARRRRIQETHVFKARPFTSLAVLLTALTLSRAAIGQTGNPETPVAPVLTPPRLLEAPAESNDAARPDHDVHVLLELVIDESGRVGAVNLVAPGDAELDARAVAAAQKFSFEPARRDGVAVAVKIRYDYVFAGKPVEAPEPVAAPEPAPAAPVPAPTQPVPAKPAANDVAEFEASATVEAPPREVTRRSVDAEVISRIPGTRGDAVRAIEIMPGVARTSINDGTPILRGANGLESQTYFNGAPVPFLYHFGGLTSFVNPRVVERVDFYPGNFSARYGRISGGAIDVHTRDPESKRLRLALDLNLIDSSAFVEAPLSDKAGISVAARRSNIDFFFENVVPKEAYSVVAAPVYYDYQLLSYFELAPKTRLRVMGYGARDSLKLFFKNPPDTDPTISGKVGATIAYHRVGVELESRPERGPHASASVTFGRIDQEAHFGLLTQAFGGYELHGRAEASQELHPTLRATIGADLFSWFVAGEYRGPAPGQVEGDPTQNSPLATQPIVSAKDDHINVVRPAAYAELAFRPVSPLLILPSVRVDYLGDTKHAAFDPRLSLRYELSPQTTLKGGVGMYSQAPEWWQTIKNVGNPNIAPYRALQTSAGVEQKVDDWAKLGAEGFYKRMYDVIVSTAGSAPPRFENTGRGQIYGLELSGQARWASQGMAYLAYTLSRSERSDHGGDFRLFDRDQTHILSLVLSQGLGKGWEVGARFRMVSGNPTTPITSAVYDARSGVYVPVYGAAYSARDPMFHQLDVRVEKSFHAGPVKLAAYLEVMNAYNAKNYQGADYSFDYSKKEQAPGMPLFPNLGLKGEL
ncbi:MAG: TonB-dependent receptor [Polyangiaceae bacterium]